MFYPNPGQKVIFEQFEKLQENLAEVLSYPLVRSELGSIALEIEAMHSSAFVPNLRNGLFEVPRNQRDSENLAIVPLTEQQASDAYELVSSLCAKGPVRTWTRAEAAVSKRYSLNIPDELDSLFQVGPPGEANAPTLRGLRPRTLARTMATMNRIHDDMYGVSRPVLLIRNRLLEGDTRESGAIIAHETIHASDLLEDGVLFGTLTYGAATELRAYYVGAAVCKMTDLDSVFAHDSIRIDTIRVNALGNVGVDKRFTPDPLLVGVLQAEGRI